MMLDDKMSVALSTCIFC